VVKELHVSHSKVGRVYELEDRIRAVDQTITDPELEKFAIDRLHHAVRFTASLYQTAWIKSHDVGPPDWLDRDTLNSEVSGE